MLWYACSHICKCQPTYFTLRKKNRAALLDVYFSCTANLLSYLCPIYICMLGVCICVKISTCKCCFTFFVCTANLLSYSSMFTYVVNVTFACMFSHIYFLNEHSKNGLQEHITSLARIYSCFMVSRTASLLSYLCPIYIYACWLCVRKHIYKLFTYVWC